MGRTSYVMNLWEFGPEVFIGKDASNKWKVLAIEGKKPDGTIIQVDPDTGMSFTSELGAKELVTGLGYTRIVPFMDIKDPSERRGVLLSYNTLNPGDLRSKVIPHIPMPPKEERLRSKYGDNLPTRFVFSDFMSERNLLRPDGALVQSADEARAFRQAVLSARDAMLLMNKSRPNAIPLHYIEKMNKWAREWFQIAEKFSMDFHAGDTRKGPPVTYIVKKKSKAEESRQIANKNGKRSK